VAESQRLIKMEFITAKELFENKNHFLVLDIRDAGKFRQNTVEGSINIDVYMDIHEGRFEIVRKKLGVLPKEKEIILVCNTGSTTQPACAILESMGYKAKVLELGMVGWNAR